MKYFVIHTCSSCVYCVSGCQVQRYAGINSGRRYRGQLWHETGQEAHEEVEAAIQRDAVSGGDTEEGGEGEAPPHHYMLYVYMYTIIMSTDIIIDRACFYTCNKVLYTYITFLLKIFTFVHCFTHCISTLSTLMCTNSCNMRTQKQS